MTIEGKAKKKEKKVVAFLGDSGYVFICSGLRSSKCQPSFPHGVAPLSICADKDWTGIPPPQEVDLD